MPRWRQPSPCTSATVGWPPHEREDQRAARRRGGGDRRGAGHGRARGRARAVPGPQGGAAEPPARRRPAPARGARHRRPRRQRGAQGARGGDRGARRRARGRRARRPAGGRRRRRHAARLARRGPRPHPPPDRYAARDRGRLPRPRVPRDGGPRDRGRLLQLRRAQPRRAASVAARVRHLLHDRRRGPAHAHVADAGPRDGPAPAAALHRRSRPHLPARQRRHPHAAVPPGRGARGRRGRHARRPPGHAARLRPGHLRRGPARPPAPALLPVHRAERRVRRIVLQLQGRLPRRRLALPALQGRGLDRDPRRRRGRPQRVRVRARERLRPRAPPGLRVRDGHRADRHAQARRARPAAALRQRPALPGAVRMRVPLLWLEDYCDPGLSLHDLEHRLTMTGTKVEALHRHGVGALEHFVVGRVLSAEQHPDADRLTVCMVDVGEGDPRQIVCGAPNVTAGQIVAVAGPGAVMPDGTRLKRAKLRGVESNGMILAEDEVAIGPDHDGIMVLPDELVPGTPLADVLPIATDVLELEITPNRPDCLSVYGVAREVHAATGAPLAPPPWSRDPGSDGPVEGVTVEVQDHELCPRFTARLYDDVTIGPSPEWLKARLSAAGMRPINNVVDITNFVMLATGQPMHAFDHDLVAGGRLVVRRALDGETMTTLDDVQRSFDSDMVIICDDDGPTSIAGIMGGERSEVRPTTTRVLMEAATWNGPNIQRSSTRLALRSEASGRFEKQLQPEQAMDGQALAAILMTELTGARIVDGTVDVGGWAGTVSVPVTLRLRDE